jgi:hypothetical protein
MLRIFFVICAAGGGALVLLQTALSLLAMGVHHGPHVHRHGGKWGHRASGARHHGPVHAGPAHKGIVVHRTGAMTRGHPSAAPHHAEVSTGADSTILAWLHGLLNFQGIVAGAAVLGLAGLAATAGGLSGAVSLAIAAGAGLLMMIVVAGLFAAMLRMDEDGTLQIEQAVGAVGRVYLTVPGNHAGQGKVTVAVQQRAVELRAVTYGEKDLAMGETVTVVGVGEDGVVEVVGGTLVETGAVM